MSVDYLHIFVLITINRNQDTIIELCSMSKDKKMPQLNAWDQNHIEKIDEYRTITNPIIKH